MANATTQQQAERHISNTSKHPADWSTGSDPAKGAQLSTLETLMEDYRNELIRDPNAKIEGAPDWFNGDFNPYGERKLTKAGAAMLITAMRKHYGLAVIDFVPPVGQKIENKQEDTNEQANVATQQTK